MTVALSAQYSLLFFLYDAKQAQLNIIFKGYYFDVFMSGVLTGLCLYMSPNSHMKSHTTVTSDSFSHFVTLYHFCSIKETKDSLYKDALLLP